MPCNPIKLPGGGSAIICSRGPRRKPCCHCGRPSDKLCDFPLTGAKAGSTCDRPVCENHAIHREPDTDYCPTHGRMVEEKEASGV